MFKLRPLIICNTVIMIMLKKKKSSVELWPLALSVGLSHSVHVKSSL